MTTREVEWDPDQQALLLGLDLGRRETCEGCGRPLAESTDGANEYGYDVTPVPCHACESVAARRDQYMESNKTSKHTSPARFIIRKR